MARILHRRQAELFHQAAADPAARRNVETWRDCRAQLARLLLATADGRDDPDDSRGSKRSQQKRIASSGNWPTAFPRFARDQALERSAHTKLVEALPEHTVVLDLFNYTRFEQDPEIKGAKGRRRTQSYIGFVLAKGRPVRAVDLGPAAPIDEAVGSLARGHLRDGKRVPPPRSSATWSGSRWRDTSRPTRRPCFLALDGQLDRSPLGRTARRQARHRAPGAVRPGHCAPCPIPPRPPHRARATAGRPRHPAGRRRRGLRPGSQARRG